MNPTIALLTDFGTEDIYVGVMKGVMREICPQATFIDITHQINPQNVRQAAFALKNALPYFPPQTVFLVVVDPGVGTRRRPIAARFGNYSFVAPDNGVLSYAFSADDEVQFAELDRPDFWISNVSQTFHGRDIFAPVAAHLASGKSLDVVGTSLQQVFELPQPALDIDNRYIYGEVVHIDRFGNIITSIGRLRWSGGARVTLMPAFGNLDHTISILSEDAQLQLSGETISTIKTTYSDAMRGDLLMLVGSSGYLEIAMNQGNAAERLDVVIGDRIEVQLGDAHAAIHN